MRKNRFKIGLSVALFSLLLGGCMSNNEMVADTNSAGDVQQTENSAKSNDLTIHETDFGKVQGISEDGVYKWLGVPYGGDISAENRWQAPTDPEEWSDVLDTTKPGNVALQLSADGVIGSESALNLDVYRPENEKEDLPVLVFIHGGNNQTGQAQEISGASFARNQDAIVVSVNYRLGELGFNPLPALKTGTAEEDSGNYTMLDLEKSLTWIRENIENFGGDSNNVTVSGFSANGRDVMAMLTSPLFEVEFDKAISFSGGMTIANEDNSQEVFAQAIAPLVVEDDLKETEEEARKWLLEDNPEVKDYLFGVEGDRLVSLMGWHCNTGRRIRYRKVQ